LRKELRRFFEGAKRNITPQHARAVASPAAMTRRVALCALVLAALARPARAQWTAMPPECEGRCWETDNEHPLARCPPDVLDHVVTAAQADALVRAAEAYAGVHGWTTKRHAQYPTTDLPWYVLPPEARTIIDDVWRVMASNVKKRCGLARDAKLTINDVFVVKYTPEGQPGLHRHRDGSFASFNLMLSDQTDYEGGGTRMWDANEVDKRKAEYWAAERRERRDDGSSDATSVPRGGWTAYDPKPNVLNVAHATVYRLDKGQMLTAGGFNAHEGLPVTNGARYIVAGFVGLNRHCCAFKHAGWRGLLGFFRVFMLKRVDAEYGKDAISPHDWRMYEEGRRALRGAFLSFCVAAIVLASAIAALARRGGPTATLRAWRRRRKRRGLLPSKSYD
jgi:hypothetical protein